MSSEIKVVEVKRIPQKANIILGLPDAGLVGSIAATHVIEEMKLNEVGFLESKLFPPIVVVHEHTPKSPIRIYGEKNLFVLVSEMPISPYLVQPLADSLVSWLKKKNPQLVVSLGGISRQDRVEIDNPNVYALPSDESILKMLSSLNISIFEEGLLVGSYGVILKACRLEGIPAVYLMAESHLRYPDPGAAASALEVVNKLINTNISTKALKEKSEEIKIKARDLMKRTDYTMNEMQKLQEQEIPMMYR